MHNRIFPLLVCFLLALSSSAQSRRMTDSLLHIAQKNPADTNSIRAYIDLSNLTTDSSYDVSLGFAAKGLALADKLDDDYWRGRSSCQLGLTSYSYSRSMEALGYFSTAIGFLKKKNDHPYWIAKSLNGMGNAQRQLGRVKEATDSYLDAKKIFESIADKKGIAGVYNNLGIIFMAEGQQQKALEYYKIARRYNIEINNQPWLGRNLSNMGTAFYNLQKYDSAEVYFRDAQKVYLAVGDSGSWASDMTNLGNVYTEKKDYARAKEQFLLALDFDRRNNYEADMSFVMLNYAGLFTITGDLVNAKIYLDSSLAICTKYNNMEVLLDVYKGYTALYEKSGDYKNAYKYYNLYATKKDSITTLDMKNQMDQMEESLREEKLREQNTTLQQQKILQDVQLNRSNIILYTAIGGIILLLLLAFALYKRYQLKQKANVLLTERNLEIESQKAIIEQKNQDISDSIHYAKKIQDTLLPDPESFHAVFSNAFIFFRPCNVVSGDFYWFSSSGNKDFVAVADCTGHGVPGAFMSMLGIEKFNQAILESDNTSPSDILTTVNRQLKTVLKQDERAGRMRDGMDVAMAAIDREQMTLEYSGANRPLWIIRNGELIELEPTKVALGGHTPNTQEFTRHTFALQKNDCIYLFSDGYADQFGGPRQKKMMTKNFRQVVLSAAHLPMAEQQKLIAAKFDEWKNDLEQVDDVCVMGIRLG